MSLITLMREIGEDADLLTRSDEWLECQRRSTAETLNKAAKELRAILLAQQIKTALQQKNLVAVQQILRTADGEIFDIIVRIVNLPDALVLLRKAPKDEIEEANTIAQLHGWESDGYDIERSSQLR